MWIHLLPLGLIDGAGGVAPVVSAGRSGVSRLWLVEYYTRELAKKQLQRAAEALLVEPFAEPAEQRKIVAKEKALRKKRVAALATQAAADLDALAQGIKSVEAAQQFTQQLILHAQNSPMPAEETDFLSLAQDYRERIRRDEDELLLLSMVV